MKALIKSQTAEPRCRSSVMPVSAFQRLFRSWPPNKQLPTAQLRLKTLTLMALAFMLRPSDVAPKAIRFEPSSNTKHKITFSTEHVQFLDNGSIQVTFFGIKNDTDRSGSVATLPPAPDATVDPITALRCYIDRTAHERASSPDSAVFLPLNPPYQALGAGSISTILEDAIKLAGLHGQGFSAKSFRSTGATMAIENHQAPEIVMKIGRWKTSSVFYGHYVHSKTPQDFTGAILS